MNESSSARALIEVATRDLQAADVESARLDAELLLEHATGLPRLRRMALGEDAVETARARAFLDLVARRATREPLQHVVGSTSFLGLVLRVDRRALVPRPETEQLALMASACIRDVPAPRILDVGTGSGCLALALATAHPGAEVVAMDVSAEALALAEANGRGLGMEGRIRWIQGDAFGDGTGLGALGGFDLVVSNPPYLLTGELASLEPEVRDHDPRLALDGGEDGLGPYRVLAGRGRHLVREGGWMALEFGDGQGPALTRLFTREEWGAVQLGKDLSGRDRVLIVRGSRR